MHEDDRNSVVVTLDPGAPPPPPACSTTPSQHLLPPRTPCHPAVVRCHAPCGHASPQATSCSSEVTCSMKDSATPSTTIASTLTSTRPATGLPPLPYTMIETAAAGAPIHHEPRMLTPSEAWRNKRVRSQGLRSRRERKTWRDMEVCTPTKRRNRGAPGIEGQRSQGASMPCSVGWAHPGETRRDGLST